MNVIPLRVQLLPERDDAARMQQSDLPCADEFCRSIETASEVRCA